MPIEIKELIVRVVVDPPAAPAAPGTAAEVDRTALIEACVEETLRVLRRARER